MIMNFDEFKCFLVFVDIEDIHSIEIAVDEMKKYKNKDKLELDEPTKRYLDSIIANYKLSKLKREYLNKNIQTDNPGGEEFTS